MFSLKIRDDIELRVFAETDAEEIFNVVKENYEHLRPFLHWVTPEYSLESARDFTKRAQKPLTENAGQTYGIFHNEKIVGAIGFVNSDWQSRRTEIGYWIAKDYEGRGIVTESCKALVDYAFQELRMNRVEMHCATENTRSRAIPERLNFKLDGILRQSEWRHTRFYDMAVYSLLAEEASSQ